MVIGAAGGDNPRIDVFELDPAGVPQEPPRCTLPAVSPVHFCWPAHTEVDAKL